ncbi:MAG TPA: DUF4373 domain-containing protein [Candidatus Scybalocola faecavium]|nr:DUF4373 domain-containing protein [Candidatus Scybalocola faecavium]
MASRRGRPYEAGLSYFPKMVDFYEDDKIFDLLDQYGPLGVTIYDCILCIVYKHGYYVEIPLEKLSRMIVKMIGNKWVKQKAVVQVIHFISGIGLIDDALVKENIITSVGIQRRYYETAVKRMKRRLHDDRYWLLEKEENGEGLLNAPKNRINSEENQIDSESKPITSEISDTKIKEKKNNIYISTAPPTQNRFFPDDELNKAFSLYVTCRANNGDKLQNEQIDLLIEQLNALSDKNDERIAMVKQATMKGWKGFYPLKKPKSQGAPQKQAKPKNRFKNFDERSYDYAVLERSLYEKRMSKEDENDGKKNSNGNI